MYHSAGCIWNDICDRDYDKLVGQYSFSILYYLY